MTQTVNNHLVLLGGKSAAGKSASLMGLKDPEGVMYLNCEAGKLLPFRSKFKEFVITDPYQVEEAFQRAEDMPEIHTIVVDSLTYMMDMFESVYVYKSTNTMAAWGDFAQFFKRLMQQHVAASSKNVVFTAHTADSINEAEMVSETKVPVKGSLKANGVESYFSCVIASKKVTLKNISDFKSDLLAVTPEEEALGFKYIFQTKLTKETVNERLRSSLGLWNTNETFIDNNMQNVFDRLHEYYA
jgi:hypothetical protein